MVGFQTQRRGSWIPGKERAEKSWRVRSRLMGERSGHVNLVQGRTRGGGGVAGAAIMTSQHICVGSAGRRSPQGLENGLRAPRRQAERNTESPKNWRQKMRSFGPGLRPWRRKEGEEPKEGKAFHPGDKSGMEEECGMDMDVEDEIESRKKLVSRTGSCRRSCEKLKNSRVCRKMFRKASSVTCSSNCKRWSKGGMMSCQSTRKCRTDHKHAKHSG